MCAGFQTVSDWPKHSLSALSCFVFNTNTDSDSSAVGLQCNWHHVRLEIELQKMAAQWVLKHRYA